MKTKLTAYLLTLISISLLFTTSASALYNAAGDELPTSVPKTPEVTVDPEEPENNDIEESAETENAAPTSCVDIQDAIDNKIIMYSALEPEVISTFEVMEMKINTYIEKAEILGYDTRELETNMTELNSLVTTLANNINRFQNLLAATKTYACGTTEESYVNSIIQAKEGLAEVRENIKAIEDFYKQDIKNSILVLSQGEVENE